MPMGYLCTFYNGEGIDPQCQSKRLVLLQRMMYLGRKKGAKGDSKLETRTPGRPLNRFINPRGPLEPCKRVLCRTPIGGAHFIAMG